MKVHILSDNVWEQAQCVHYIERDAKILKPVVDVGVNEHVRWSVANGRCYLVIIFTVSSSEVILPRSEEENASLTLGEASRKFIKDTNERCRQIQKAYKGDVYRFIVVPDGRLTDYPLALVGEQWHEDGLGQYTFIYIRSTS